MKGDQLYSKFKDMLRKIVNTTMFFGIKNK